MDPKIATRPKTQGEVKIKIISIKESNNNT